ncbi:hypothetical protein Sm713_45790 [Streptomyces sp. TS71-3]|nr:hypothetical protein Sm713_45790 [Streptomyces sp. TS71-3]
MTAPIWQATGRRRRLLVPVSAESIRLAPRAPQPDPPIYRALLRSWAERGKTLPGRHDPEWVRLAAPPVPFRRVSPFQDRAGDGR